MHSTFRIAGLAGVLLVLAAPAVADVIHVPTEEPTVAAAVAAAADGDLILVSPSNDTQLVLIDGKSLSIVGIDGIPKVRSIQVRNLAPGQSVLLQNLQIGPLTPTPLDDNDAVTLLDCAGSVRIEACRLEGIGGHSGTVLPFLEPEAGASGLRTSNCQDVVVVGGTLLGGAGGSLDDEDFDLFPTAGGAAANVRTSRVAFFGVTLVGGDGGLVNDSVLHTGGAGGEGLLNVTGLVHVSGCTLEGGTGGWGDCDDFVGSCGLGGTGGDAIHQMSPVASLTLRDNELVPGAGGPGGDGVPAPDGEPLGIDAGTVQSFEPAYRHLDLSGAAAEGDHLAVTVTGQAGDVVFLGIALQPGWLEKPALDGLFQVSELLLVLPAGTVTGTSLVLGATVPELGPGVLHVLGPLQLAIGDTEGIHLGPSRTLVLRDAAE